MSAYDMQESYKVAPYPFGGVDDRGVGAGDSRMSGMDVVVEDVVKPEGRKGDTAGMWVLLVCFSSFLLLYLLGDERDRFR